MLIAAREVVAEKDRERERERRNAGLKMLSADVVCQRYRVASLVSRSCSRTRPQRQSVGRKRFVVVRSSEEPSSSSSTEQESDTVEAMEGETSGFSFGPKLLAPAGIGLGVALFVLSRTSGGIASLEDLAQSSVPLDVAMTNGRPSVVEFYADWCEVCKSLAKDSSTLKQRYGDRVNFVMLNVDNPKWAEEVAEYRVGGIPHWEYLDSRGNSKGFVVGNLPKEILEANANALSKGDDTSALPYVRKVFASSPIQENLAQPDQTQPRDHG